MKIPKIPKIPFKRKSKSIAFANEPRQSIAQVKTYDEASRIDLFGAFDTMKKLRERGVTTMNLKRQFENEMFDSVDKALNRTKSLGKSKRERALHRVNRALNPIDRLDSNGQAEKMRKYLTDFGSPWRGLMRVSSKFIKSFTDEASGGVTFGIDGWEQEIKTKLHKMYGADHYETGRILSGLEEAKKAGHEKLVFVNEDLTGTQLRSTIRHERHHQFKGGLDEGAGEKAAEFFRKNPMPKDVIDDLELAGYKKHQMPDEIYSLASELRYMSKKFGGPPGSVKRNIYGHAEEMARLRSNHGEELARLRGAYGDQALSYANQLHTSLPDGGLITSAKGLLERPVDGALGLPEGMVQKMKQARKATFGTNSVNPMQASTNIVKANFGNTTTPGCARSTQQTGSRIKPNGGT
jgi:hypothetical protein